MKINTSSNPTHVYCQVIWGGSGAASLGFIFITVEMKQVWVVYSYCVICNQLAVKISMGLYNSNKQQKLNMHTAKH